VLTDVTQKTVPLLHMVGGGSLKMKPATNVFYQPLQCISIGNSLLFDACSKA